MNEYLKRIYDDAQKFMPHGKNGLMWTSGTWSENHVMLEDEKQNWDRWLNEILISNESQEFNRKIFEEKVVLFKRKLPKTEFLSSIFIYQDGEKFNLEPSKLNNIIRDICLQTNKSQEGVWFYGNQSDNHLYNVNGYGTYTLKSLKTETEFVNYEATLEPLFSNLINENRNQFLRHSHQLFSGVIGNDKSWLILISLKKKVGLEITIHSDATFCKFLKKILKMS